MESSAVQRLRAGLSGVLPGFEAQARMAPRPRPGWYDGTIPDDVRQGAALVLLYPAEEPLHVVLTVRRRDLPQHGGQVSLPGGAREPGESVVDAALREANEEVGIDPAGIEVLGRLTPLHIPASGFVLHAVVAHGKERPELHPADGEVERILEIPLTNLLDSSRLRVERRDLGGRERDIPFFDLEGEKVWGATAMILAELLWLLGAAPDPWRGGGQRPNPV